MDLFNVPYSSISGSFSSNTFDQCNAGMQQAIQSIMTIEDPQVRNEALQKLKPVQDFLDGNRPFSSQSTGTIHSLFSKRLIEINQSKLVSKLKRKNYLH